MITSENLITVSEPRMPRDAFKGELRTHDGEYVANVYVVNHRVIIAAPREFGRGEIAKRLPGDFDPKQFERAGGCQYSASQYVKFWQFKPTTPTFYCVDYASGCKCHCFIQCSACAHSEAKSAQC